MNIKTYSFKIIFIFFTVFLFSCGADKNLPEQQIITNKYLVDFKKVSAVSAETSVFVMSQIEAFSDSDLSFKDKVKHNVSVYKVTYNTEFKGEEILASGLVIVPQVNKSLPIISVQNGTNTLHANAPSANVNSQNVMVLATTASLGFVVAVSDYIGFGASKNRFHPYLDKTSTVRSSIDLLKAAKELMLNQSVVAALNNDLFISGYSQGGWATMVLQEELENVQPNLFDLKASSCGAGPYELEIVIKEVLKKQTYNNPYFLAYVFNTMYEQGVLTDALVNEVLKAPFASKFSGLFNGEKSGTQINAALTTTVSDLLTDDFINNYETSENYRVIRNWLKNNSVDFWKTNVPTKLFHGNSDLDVPFKNSKSAYEKFIALGVSDSKIQLFEGQGKTHYSMFIPYQIKTIEWFLSLK